MNLGLYQTTVFKDPFPAVKNKHAHLQWDAFTSYKLKASTMLFNVEKIHIIKIIKKRPGTTRD